MRKYLVIFIIGLAVNSGPGLFRASATLEVSAGVSIHSTAEFYEPLAPHGAWVEVGSYGRCWHPVGIEAGWRPYCNGNWEWTDCGWYWESDEPWAWACYHYGTWAFDSNYGWFWIPGVEWAPAWVTWRMGGEHIGWAPCGPAGFIVAPSLFVFVESRHFHERIRPNTVIVNNTVIINSTTETRSARREERQFDGKSQTVVVNEGPHVEVVEKMTGKKITPIPVRQADRQAAGRIPEILNHGSKGVPDEKSPIIQEMPKPAPVERHEMRKEFSSEKQVPADKVTAPERTIPQIPPERIGPPINKELPPEVQPRVKEVNPPAQSPALPVPPVMPRENREQHNEQPHGQGSVPDPHPPSNGEQNEKGHDRDK